GVAGVVAPGQARPGVRRGVEPLGEIHFRDGLEDQAVELDDERQADPLRVDPGESVVADVVEHRGPVAAVELAVLADGEQAHAIAGVEADGRLVVRYGVHGMTPRLVCGVCIDPGSGGVRSRVALVLAVAHQAAPARTVFMRSKSRTASSGYSTSLPTLM